MESPLWLLYALLSAVFAALVAIFGKIGLGKIDTTLATTVRAAVMFLLLLAAALAMGKMSGIGSIRGRAALYIILSGMAGAASWLCYFLALKLGRASHVAAVDRFSVVLVIIMAALFLGEKAAWKDWVGVGLLTVGAILIAL